VNAVGMVVELDEHSGIFRGKDGRHVVAVSRHNDCTLYLMVPAHSHEVNAEENVNPFLLKISTSPGDFSKPNLESWKLLEIIKEGIHAGKPRSLGGIWGVSLPWHAMVVVGPQPIGALRD